MSLSPELHRDLVDITPAPVLAALERGDDRMLRRMVVLGRMLVLRVVATADVAAGPAQAKVHPGIADCEALLAAGGVRSVRHYELEMLAMRSHESTPLLQRRNST